MTDLISAQLCSTGHMRFEISIQRRSGQKPRAAACSVREPLNLSNMGASTMKLPTTALCRSVLTPDSKRLLRMTSIGAEWPRQDFSSFLPTAQPAPVDRAVQQHAEDQRKYRRDRLRPEAYPRLLSLGLTNRTARFTPPRWGEVKTWAASRT